MKKKLFLPLTKNVGRRWRFGPRELQDWHRAIQLAAQLTEQDPNSEVLVLSRVRVGHRYSEADTYSHVLQRLGCTRYRVIRRTYETVGQLRLARAIADAEGARLVVISTWTHFPRVRYICRGQELQHHAVWGMPHFAEATTDILLWIGFPTLVGLGLERWFRKRAIQWRRSLSQH